MTRSAYIALVWLVVLVGGLWCATSVLNLSPTDIQLDGLYQGMSAAHWAGTDDLGRDVLVRLAGGVRLSLTVALSVLAITVLLGVPLGMMAGWYGGWVDQMVTKLTEVVLSFPGLLLALALSALMGPGSGNVVLALGVLGWVGFCRLTRVQVQSLKRQPFVAAAQLGGVSSWVIWVRHLLPLCVGPLMVEALLVASGSMVAEAGLSFLGLGVPAPTPSLGGMLRDGMRALLVAPQLVAVPAVVLISLTLSLNVLANGLKNRFSHSKTGANSV